MSPLVPGMQTKSLDWQWSSLAPYLGLILLPLLHLTNPTPNIYHCTPDSVPWPFCHNFCPWHWTLTYMYNPGVPTVKVNAHDHGHVKVQGQTVQPGTHGIDWTDGETNLRQIQKPQLNRDPEGWRSRPFLLVGTFYLYNSDCPSGGVPTQNCPVPSSNECPSGTSQMTQVNGHYVCCGASWQGIGKGRKGFPNVS